MSFPPARLGWPGVATLLALAAAAALAGWWTPQWQQQAAAQQSQRLQARSAPPVANAEVAKAAAAATDPAAQLPAAGDPAERVADLLELALRHGIAVDATQQRIERQAGLQRLRLSMAAQGSYPDLRGFIAAALQADAALALDTLRLRRASVTDSALQADLQWSLLQRQPATAATAASVAAASAAGLPTATPRGPWPAAPARAALAWAAPRAAPPAPAAPPLRAAPPAFPYSWIGRMETAAGDGAGGGTQVLLSGPLRSFGASVGEVLDGRWRIDSIAATRLQVVWLPTGEAVGVNAR